MTQLSLFPEVNKQQVGEGNVIYCWFYRHWRTGKIIRAKDKPFCFRARAPRK